MAGSSTIALPDSLVSTGWLAENLDADGLRIFDCTCFLIPDPATTYRVESGHATYVEGHIPGAGFLDLTGPFSVPGARFRFTMPDPRALAEAFAAHGVGDDSAVVLYSADTPQWATRFWWMLKVVGFAGQAAVLDGGLKKWRAEGRPVATGEQRYPVASGLTAHPRPELVVDADGVRAAMAEPGAVVVNALSAEQHAGGGIVYGRAGRIAGSANVPTRELLDPETGAFLPADAVRARFADAGLLAAKRVVPYCGGGIAASATCFWLDRLGATDVALYDNSLGEWATREDLPMETG